VHFSYDLDDMVGYCTGYERLGRLWRQRFPRRYFEHHYESLQRDPSAQIHHLLDFCGLPFDAVCLDFHQTQRTVLTFSSAQGVPAATPRHRTRSTIWRQAGAPARPAAQGGTAAAAVAAPDPPDALALHQGRQAFTPRRGLPATRINDESRW
jgi:hypothetical protein